VHVFTPSAEYEPAEHLIIPDKALVGQE